MLLTACSATAMCLIYLPWWGAAAATLGCVSSACRTIPRDALLVSPHSITDIGFGRLGLALKPKEAGWKEPQSGTSLTAAFVNRWLTVLTLQIEGRRGPTHVVLVPDNVDEPVMRHLRLWLRWSRITN